jgi:hypothetical protein
MILTTPSSVTEDIFYGASIHNERRTSLTTTQILNESCKKRGETTLPDLRGRQVTPQYVQRLYRESQLEVEEEAPFRNT